MLEQMGDLGYGGYNDNYSEYARQKSVKLQAEKDNQNVQTNPKTEADEDYKAFAQNINRASERVDRAQTQQRKPKEDSSPGTFIEKSATGTENDMASV